MYGYKKYVKMSYIDAVEGVKRELANEGFGVLTQVDVKAILKKKLDVDYNNYIILGVCNPAFAHKALQAEQDIGLMLPCNVIVYESESKVFVSAILPTEAMKMINNKKLNEIAETVEIKLKKVIDSI